MTFDEYINQKFQKNLKLAREELALEDKESHGEMEYSERRAWNVAIEWTQDDISNIIGQQLKQKWIDKQNDDSDTNESDHFTPEKMAKQREKFYNCDPAVINDWEAEE